jgi:carboxylesterase type B
MEILRTNYSTLSPYAQQDAPSAPEYPYKEFLAACRGKIEAAALDDSTEQDPHYLSNSSGSSQEATTKNEYALHHSKAFQKILTHFFGDYFTVDADEELASDMADCWASFSHTSDPNYEGSPKEWLPWWNRQTSSFELHDGNKILDFTYTDVESLWNDFEEQNVRLKR